MTPNEPQCAICGMSQSELEDWLGEPPRFEKADDGTVMCRDCYEDMIAEMKSLTEEQK